MNNPTVDDLKNIWLFNAKNTGPVPDLYTLGAVVVGWEHFRPGEGTPHLQVYFELVDTKKCRIEQVRRWFPRGHWEPRRGTPEEAASYGSSSRTPKKSQQCESALNVQDHT